MPPRSHPQPARSRPADDFNNDGYLSTTDLGDLIDMIGKRPKGKKAAQADKKGAMVTLEKAEIEDIIDRVMRDVDIDGNNRLSYAEFAKVVSRIPDFAHKFRVYIG